MNRLEYRVVLEDGTVKSGTAGVAQGVLHIRAGLPEGRIRSVQAQMPVELGRGGRIFMNGYQSWTTCPEYTKNDRIRGLKHLPKAAVRHFGLDRYADYHFVEYPEKKGITHGFSWCYFRQGERYRLIASLNEQPGYTMFRYDADTQVLTLERDCAGIVCNGPYALFDLYFAEGSEQEVFDGWFETMDVHPRTDRRLSGYSSWYNRFQKIDEASVSADLQGCEGVLSAGDLFQIDDGWEPHIGDWLEPDSRKFPNGLRPLSESIHSQGYLAGLWLAPFVCERKSELYRRHPDWLLCPDGRPWYCGCNWSGFYALDIDRPEVVDYLRRCFRRVFEEWNFDLVKLDFLYAAAPFGSDSETRAARMIRAMKLLRELCGEHLILGCGVPLMPAFGLVDYCRIGCDVSPQWNGSLVMQLAHRETVSTRKSMLNTVFRRQLNGRAWLNDPDVIFLRDDNLHLTARQKTALGTVNALFGGVFLHSDDPSGWSDEAATEYRLLLSMRDAEAVRVHTGRNIRVDYRLNGKNLHVRFR